jgi:HEAT repeat protein
MTISSNDRTRWLAATSHATPVKALLKIVLNSDRWIQERAMQTLTHKIDTSSDVLQQLVPKANYQIASMIIHHPNVTISTLQELAQSQDWRVRLSVTKHPDLPTNTLAKLAKDKDDRVRQAIAQNRNSPINTLEKLANDPQSRVRKAAVTLLTQISTSSAFVEQFEIVKQSAVSTQALEQLASIAWIQIRVEVARHPNIATSLLEKLATDVYADVRSAIAENINVPATLLEQLLDDKENAVRLAAISSPNIPISTLQELAESKKRLLNTAAVKQLLNRRIEGASKYLEPFAKSSTPSLGKLAVFLHPMAPVELLTKNVRSLSWLERYAIAQNPNTPIATLKFLANDGNRVVRATAKESLQIRSTNN